MATLVTWDEFTDGGRPQGGTIPETVLDEVTNLVSRRRPLLSSLGMRDVTGTFIEMFTDTLETRGYNAVAEGIAFTAQQLAQPVRHFNHVQTFYKSGQISDTDKKVRHYNGDPMTYQISKRLEALLNDIEHTLHRGSAATGATNLPRQTSGMLNVFPTTSSPLTFTSSSGTTLTEDVFVDLLEVWAANKLDVRPSQCYVNSKLKRTISEYSTKITRNVEAGSKMQMLIVERHESDFGALDIMFSEDQLASATKITSGNSLMFIDPSLFKVGWLTKPTVEELSRDGLRRRFQIHAECGLVYMNAQGGGGGTGYVPYIEVAT